MPAQMPSGTCLRLILGIACVTAADPPHARAGDGFLRGAEDMKLKVYPTPKNEGNATCLTNTGNYCWLGQASGCTVEKGAEYCDAGRCVCEPGFCADIYGHCQSHGNEGMVSSVRFRNARFHNLYLSLSKQGFFVTHEGPGNPDTELHTYRLAHPTKKDVPTYMLTSRDRKLAVGTHIDADAGRMASAMDLASASAEDVALHISNAPRYKGDSVDEPAVSLTVANGGRDFELFTDGTSRYVRIHDSMSQQLGISSGSVGVGALWVPEPPLPKGFPLQEYRGPPCDWDCGAHGSGTDLAHHRWGQVMWWMFWGTFLVIIFAFAWYMNRKSAQSRERLRSPGNAAALQQLYIQPPPPPPGATPR